METIDSIYSGSKTILEFAKSKKVSGLVYLSSMEVFGVTDANKEVIFEQDLGYLDILNVRSSYSESKRLVECMCKSYAEQYGLNVKVARLAQTFGAGISKNENRVFAQFARSAIRGEDIVLHTKGDSMGNYCYTTDVIKAIILLLQKGEKGQSYTVVNENSSMTIYQMAELVAKEIANDKNVEFKVKVSSSDMGKVIGRQGKIAKSIRTVMKSVAGKEGKRVNVEFIEE